MSRGKRNRRKKSNQINTTQRKHPKLCGSDLHCQSSIEFSTCCLYGKSSITVRVTLINPTRRGTFSIDHPYLPLTDTATSAQIIYFHSQYWPSLWTTPRKICVFKWFRAKLMEILIHSRATSKTNQRGYRPDEKPEREWANSLWLRRSRHANTPGWLFHLTGWWFNEDGTFFSVQRIFAGTERNQIQRSFLKNQLQGLPNARRRLGCSCRGYKGHHDQNSDRLCLVLVSVHSQCSVTTLKTVVYNSTWIEIWFLNTQKQRLTSVSKTHLLADLVSLYLFGLCENVAEQHHAHLSVQLLQTLPLLHHLSLCYTVSSSSYSHGKMLSESLGGPVSFSNLFQALN